MQECCPSPKRMTMRAMPCFLEIALERISCRKASYFQGGYVGLRVTFDTNTLDLACRPERFPKNLWQDLLTKVNGAVRSGKVKGFYSVTMLTLEGIMRRDRAAVFASSTVTSTAHPTKLAKAVDLPDLPDEIREMIGDADVISAGVTLKAEQQRTPLPQEFVARVIAAKALNVKALYAVPRIGAFAFDDPSGDYYLDRGSEAQLATWIGTAHQVSRAIEERGVGFAQIRALGKSFATDPEASWFEALEKAPSIHEKRAVERAFAEWADGDSIAAHIAYGIDIFCSDDIGRSNAGQSILDADNRAWLTAAYGVRFMTFEQLAAALA